jgi:hypothetical protein
MHSTTPPRVRKKKVHRKRCMIISSLQELKRPSNPGFELRENGSPRARSSGFDIINAEKTNVTTN